MPPELAAQFLRRKRLHKYFLSLPQGVRDWITGTITEAKKPATRLRRAERAIEWLMEVMEAERDLPPAFVRAFARNSKARQGWDAMPRGRRQMYLLTIFESRYDDTRADCLKRAINEMAQYADELKRFPPR
ncbi:MAG TPA: YdeI/OmpD-associated family protein [Candidatus Limnocylindrales bacterium]|jgi:uncharacterized protein YdeI (YjbR/CyaY-like superfamily)|nr:YdeI/OmpD-associated family protein [Candidatus Limnocylindrales bacterium]